MRTRTGIAGQANGASSSSDFSKTHHTSAFWLHWSPRSVHWQQINVLWCPHQRTSSPGLIYTDRRQGSTRVALKEQEEAAHILETDSSEGCERVSWQVTAYAMFQLKEKKTANERGRILNHEILHFKIFFILFYRDHLLCVWLHLVFPWSF